VERIETKKQLLEHVKNSIEKNFSELKNLSPEEIINNRKNKFLSIGRSRGFVKQSSNETSLSMKASLLTNIKDTILFFKKEVAIFGLLFFIFLFFYFLL